LEYNGSWVDFNGFDGNGYRGYVFWVLLGQQSRVGSMGQSMPKLTLRRLVIVGLLVTAAGFMALGALVLTDRSGSASQVLQGVPAEVLAAQGIAVDSVTAGYSPRVTTDQARAAAGFAGAPVQEIKLVHVRTSQGSVGVRTSIDKNVWAVNFVPSGLPMPGSPAGSSPNKVGYAVAFVDADNGEFLFGFSAGTK
jgi:hypothetical protein